MRKVASDDQAAQLWALWQEFEGAQTAEARFAHAVDRLMPLLDSDPGNLALLADAAENVGDEEGALRAAQRQLALEPWLEGALTSLGEDAPDVVIEADEGSLTLEYDVSGNQTGVDISGTFVIEHGGNDAVFEFTGEETQSTSTVEGSLSFNGDEVVIFSGDADDPEFTRPDGSDLTAVEVDALERMWLAFALTFGFAYDVLLPFYLLIALSGV